MKPEYLMTSAEKAFDELTFVAEALAGLRNQLIGHGFSADAAEALTVLVLTKGLGS